MIQRMLWGRFLRIQLIFRPTVLLDKMKAVAWLLWCAVVHRGFLRLRRPAPHIILCLQYHLLPRWCDRLMMLLMRWCVQCPGPIAWQVMLFLRAMLKLHLRFRNLPDSLHHLFRLLLYFPLLPTLPDLALIRPGTPLWLCRCWLLEFRQSIPALVDDSWLARWPWQVCRSRRRRWVLWSFQRGSWPDLLCDFPLLRCSLQSAWQWRIHWYMVVALQSGLRDWPVTGTQVVHMVSFLTITICHRHSTGNWRWPENMLVIVNVCFVLLLLFLFVKTVVTPLTWLPQNQDCCQ